MAGARPWPLAAAGTAAAAPALGAPIPLEPGRTAMPLAGGRAAGGGMTLWLWLLCCCSRHG